MNSQTKILLVAVLAVLGVLSWPLSSALAGPGKVAQVAERQLAKKPVERNGNNIPRYNKGRGAVAPYSTARRGRGLPWSTTFISVVMQKAGYSQHLRGGGAIKVVGGRAIGYNGTLASKARKAGKLRDKPRRGYLAFFPGSGIIAVVSKVYRRGSIEIIAGNVGDRVQSGGARSSRARFIAPW